MNSYVKYFMNECVIAGWCDENHTFESKMQKAMCNSVIDLLKVFGNEGHSGFSAPYAIALFNKASSFEPITPLTGDDSEWAEVSDGLFKNMRLGCVFKEGRGGKAYNMNGRVFWEWFKREDGEIIRSKYTNRNSRVYIDFPYVKPEKPEYVFVPTDEFPNEERV